MSFEFGFVSIFCGDMDRSLVFYHEVLGLEIQKQRDITGGRMAMLGKAGQPNIELIWRPDGIPESCSGFIIGIEVPDLEAAMDYMAEKGHPALRGPIAPSPYVRFAAFEDPDGVTVQLAQHHMPPVSL